MPGDGHYRLYMPKSEESNRLLGCFSMILFMAIAFGVIVGSAYLYGTIKHKIKGDKPKTEQVN